MISSQAFSFFFPFFSKYQTEPFPPRSRPDLKIGHNSRILVRAKERMKGERRKRKKREREKKK